MLAQEVPAEVTEFVVSITRDLTGIGAIVTAGAGLLLVLRTARSKGRRDAIAEADAVGIEVQALREKSLTDTRELYELRRKLAEKGIE